MSHDAFLKAIIDRPDDDVPRLVYADWLDEHGDADRAEFIRVQCELARTDEADPRYRALEDREHELLDANEGAWLGSDLRPFREWTFARGFLRDISTSPAALAPIEAGLFASHPITSWTCQTPPEQEHLSPDDLLPLACLRRLESLRLYAIPPDISDFRRVLLPAQLPRLRSLDLWDTTVASGHVWLLTGTGLGRQLSEIRLGTGVGIGERRADDFPIDVAALNAALEGGRLDSLSAVDCGLTTDHLRRLLEAPHAESLTELDVSDNPIAPGGWDAFRAAKCRLRHLDVSGTPLAGIALEPLLASPCLGSLTELEMSRCGSARRNMEVLADSAFWTRATHLRAEAGTIPAMTLEPLCRSKGPPALRLLDLADNFLRTEGVEMLCAAPWAGALTFLALNRNYLDEDSAVALAESGRFTNLRKLHLAQNNVRLRGADAEELTDRAARTLASAPSLANLRVLSMGHTGITDEAAGVLLDGPHWRLSGLGLAGCDLSAVAVRALATSARLARLTWLDLSGNPRLGGSALMPLAESPYLSRLCDLDIGSVYPDDRTLAALRDRLGPRLSE